MGTQKLSPSIEALQEQFSGLDWTYHDFPVGSQNEKNVLLARSKTGKHIDLRPSK